MSIELIVACLDEALATGDATHLRVAEDVWQDLTDREKAECLSEVKHPLGGFFDIVRDEDPRQLLEAAVEEAVSFVGYSLPWPTTDLEALGERDWMRILGRVLAHWALLRGELTPRGYARDLLVLNGFTSRRLEGGNYYWTPDCETVIRLSYGEPF